MLHFISTPYNSFIAASTVTAIRVTGTKVIVRSDTEHDFIYATCTDETEASKVAQDLLDGIGAIVHY